MYAQQHLRSDACLPILANLERLNNWWPIKYCTSHEHCPQIIFPRLGRAENDAATLYSVISIEVFRQKKKVSCQHWGNKRTILNLCCEAWPSASQSLKILVEVLHHCHWLKLIICFVVSGNLANIPSQILSQLLQLQLMTKCRPGLMEYAMETIFRNKCYLEGKNHCHLYHWILSNSSKHAVESLLSVL